MKKVILILTIVAFFSVSTPAQAAWYDWFLGAKKETPIEITDPNNPKSDTTQVAPVTEIEALKAEVATLKASLDTLNKAQNGLTENFKQLLQVTTAFRNELKSLGGGETASLNARVTSLEKELRDVCAQVFSSLGGFSTKCPSSLLVTGATLEGRIKKLESGF